MEEGAMVEILAASDAPKQRFLVGDLVEVRMKGKGLRGSWHGAKVVEVHKGKREVEYDELLQDDNETKLKEVIPVGRASDGDNLMGTLPSKTPPKKSRPFLRPRPPPYPDSQPIAWQEGACVDCLYEDAWWEGVLVEDISMVNVDEMAHITRKSEVEVFFPGENDISKMSVSVMRIGQEWDEETGNWSLKGCAPFPERKANKKRSKKDARQSQSETSSEHKQPQALAIAPVLPKETEAAATDSHGPTSIEAAIESELCENPLAVNRLINDLCQNVQGQIGEVVGDSAIGHNSRGYGYEERLNMFQLGGGSSSVSPKQPVDACPAIEELPLEDNDGEVNAKDDPKVVEQVGVQSPVGSNVVTAAQNEEAAQNFLRHTGWKISKTVLRKTGDVKWTCKSPKVTGTGVKTFSSLLEALSFEAEKGSPDNNVQEVTSLSQSNFADQKDGVNGSSANTGEDEDENDEYGVFVRQILKKSGWEVFNSLRTGSNGKIAWVYRTPKAGSQSRKWFKNWRMATEEHIKQDKVAPKQEASVSNQKKRGGRGQDLSPLPTPKRVTRGRSTPETAKKSADGSGPIFAMSEEAPNSALPETILSPRENSDLDDNAKRDVHIVVNSVRKRTAVNLGQKFTRSNSTSPSSLLVNSYLEKPFGSISTFTQNDNGYLLQVITRDFLKEQISVTVEKNDLLINASYVVEERFDHIPVRCNGSVSARMTLPKNVEREKITAELEGSLLTLILPKSSTMPGEIFEITIR